MSKLSIYETGWINLVFEGRNKEYGAYQLRRDSTKTALIAFSMGLLLIASVFTLTLIVNRFSPNAIPKIEIPEFATKIHLSDIIPNQLRNIEKPLLPQTKKQNPETVIQNDQLVNPEIVPATQANQDIAKNTENKSVSDVITDGTATTGMPATSSPGTGTTDTPNAIDSGNAVVATVALDKLPEFPGGIKKFYNYVGNNFEKQEIDGESIFRVIVFFVIERDGSMTDIEVKKDPGYGLGKEAVRVLKSLRTKWKPGMIEGKAVRTAYSLPITVEMN